MTRLALGLIAGLASLPAYAEDLPQTVPATDSAVSTMTDAERKAFRDEMRAYLLDHPEVLIEAMDVLQRREEDAALARDTQFITVNSALIFANTNDWVGGNPKGDITLVEFMDYRCGYCRKAYDEIEELVKSDGNIRFILKEYPILGEESVTSSRFAVAVLQLAGPAAYKQAHDALITLRGTPDEATLTRLAGELGLDAPAVLARMNAEEVTAVLAANQALGDAMAITGTPTFVIDGMLLRGYVPLDGLREIVAGERES